MALAVLGIGQVAFAAPEPPRCSAGEFEYRGDCHALGQVCSDYDGTLPAVCNNRHDELRCGWDDETQTCVPEALLSGPQRCGPREIAHGGRCYDLKRECAGYSRTHREVCGNGIDRLACEWNERTRECFPAGGFGGDRCGAGEMLVGGRCYRLGRKCSDYDGTHRDVCRNEHDRLKCAWSRGRRICFPDR